MRIVFIGGANSIHCYKWIKFFTDLDIEIIWVTISSNKLHNIEKVKYISVRDPRTFLGFFSNIINLRKNVRITSRDIIHVHSIGSYALLTLILCWKINNKLVVTPWGSDLIYGWQNIFKKVIIKAIVKRANLITCDALFMRDLIGKLTHERKDIRLINFGVNTKLFRRKNTKISKKEKYGEKLVIISTRNFEAVYDVETVIKACELLKLQKIPFHLLLVGVGSQQKYLKQLIFKSGLNAQTTFLGRIDNSNLPDLLNEADVYVSSSLSDAGIAASTAEAMACELPVIITNTAENSSWIQHSENGFLFNPGDFNELAVLLRSFFKNKDNNFWGANARKTILLRNDYENEMTKMYKLYLDLQSD